MSQYSGPRGPMPTYEPPIQLLPAAEEFAEKQLTLEVNAPERADWRVLLNGLSNVEQGLVNKKIEEIKNKEDSEGHSFYLSMFEREFDENPQYWLQKFASEKPEDKRLEEITGAINDLKSLQEILKSEDEANNREIQRQFAQYSTRNANLGPEVERELANLLRAGTDEKNARRKTLNKLLAAISDIHDKQIKVRLEMMDGLSVAWDDLSDETQSHVKQLYFQYRWKQEGGTIERDAELFVITKHRARAPRFVLDGRERHIYDSILIWRGLKETLDTTDDPEARAKIEADMHTQEEVVERWSSAITGTFNWRTELGAIGDTQLKSGAWSEIFGRYDKLRQADGGVKKAFILQNATYDQGSWESVAEKSDIFLQFGTAKNALKKLLSLGQEGLSLAMVNMADPDEPFIPHSKGDKSELRRTRSDIRSVEEQIKDKEQENRRLTQLRDRAIIDYNGESQQEIRRLEALVRAGHATAQTGQRQGQGNRTGITELLAAAWSRHNQLHDTQLQSEDTIGLNHESILELREKQRVLEAKLAEVNRKRTFVDEENAAIRNAEASPLDPELYDKLIRDLKAFTEQKALNKGFYEFFKPREVRIIAQLSGMHAQKTRTGEYRLAVSDIVHDGDSTHTGVDGTSVDYSGDYAFINVAAVGEQAGRLSPTIVEDILGSPEKFPEVHALMEKLKTQNKIVILLNTPVQHDLDGGSIERAFFGTGHGFNVETANALKQENNWNDIELFRHWLDDLEIQKKLGIHPEDIDERRQAWLARQNQLRNKHFKASEGWTFVSSNVNSSTATFFETTVSLMVDHGLKLNSQDFRRLPFSQYLGRTNEYSATITDSDNTRSVKYRNQELTDTDEAPKTVAARLYQAISNKLALYHQRTQIGGQSYVNGDGISEEQADKMGSFIQANMALIEDKMMQLRAIYDDPRLNPDERIDALLNFRDNQLTHLSYDLIDENGELIVENSNPELWEHLNAKSQWLGKLKRNAREAEERYANTVMNRNSTEQDKLLAHTDYIYHLNERRNFELQQYMLGQQASGKLNGLDNKQIEQMIGKKHARIGIDSILRVQEQSMRSHLKLDEDMPPEGLNLMRRVVGSIANTQIVNAFRKIGHRIGLGDRMLINVDNDTVKSHVRRKIDSQIYKRAAAHMALSVRTGHQEVWSEIFDPRNSELLYNEENTGIKGKSPGVGLSRAGRLYLQALERRIAEDVGDAIGRKIGNDIHPMVKVLKEQGWNFSELSKTYLDAEMNDSQEARNGEMDPYSKQKTPISMLESTFWREFEKRVDVNRSLLPWRSPDDNNYVAASQSRTPMIRQYPDYR